MVNKPTELKTITIDINNTSENLEKVKTKIKTQINNAIAEIKSNFPLGNDEGWTKNVLSSDCAEWLTKINNQTAWSNSDLTENKKDIIFYGNRVLAEIWIEWNKIWASKIEMDKNNSWEKGKESEKNLQSILNWANHNENTATKKTINNKTKNSEKTYQTIIQKCIKDLLDKFREYAKNNQPGGGSWNLKTGDYAGYEAFFDNTSDLNNLSKIKKTWEVLGKIVVAKKISKDVPEIDETLEALENCQKSEQDIYNLLKKLIDEAVAHLKEIKKENSVIEIDELLQEIASNDKTNVEQVKIFIKKLEKWTEQTKLNQEINQKKKKEVNDNLKNLKIILNQLEEKTAGNNKEEKPILVALSFIVLILILTGLALWSIKRWNNKSFED